jgi:hypothetical protein
MTEHVSLEICKKSLYKVKQNLFTFTRCQDEGETRFQARQAAAVINASPDFGGCRSRRCCLGL